MSEAMVVQRDNPTACLPVITHVIAIDGNRAEVGTMDLPYPEQRRAGPAYCADLLYGKSIRVGQVATRICMHFTARSPPPSVVIHKRSSRQQTLVIISG